MNMGVYGDSDHAGYQVTRCSTNGFALFLNTVPICLLYKNKTYCETVTFFSEAIK